MAKSNTQPKRYEPWLSITADMEGPESYCETHHSGGRQLSYADAIREALNQAMHLDQRVFVMGQDVDAPTAMFGTTKDLHKEHGPERSFDTPLAETALMGIAVGAALGGMRPVYLHNRPDFLLLASDQLINHASKWHYMFGGEANVPLVVWACIGRGWGSAAQHSQALQGLFMHVPGLKLVMPSTAHDAKGLMLGAVADDNPVLILDHRFNFKQEGNVPEEMYTLPLGKGIVRRAGTDVTLIAISHMVHVAHRAAEMLVEEGIEAEVLDLRTLCPLDEDLILQSVARTGRAVIADCGWKTCGVTSEIAAILAERAFSCLKAPVRRVACPDVPTPAGFTLEAGYYPDEADIVTAVREICD